MTDPPPVPPNDPEVITWGTPTEQDADPDLIRCNIIGQRLDGSRWWHRFTRRN